MESGEATEYATKAAGLPTKPNLGASDNDQDKQVNDKLREDEKTRNGMAMDKNKDLIESLVQENMEEKVQDGKTGSFADEIVEQSSKTPNTPDLTEEERSTKDSVVEDEAKSKVHTKMLDQHASTKSQSVRSTSEDKDSIKVRQTPKSILVDPKAGKTVSNKSPAVHFSEIEDERTIRVESPLIKRETILSEPPQDDEKFDPNDLSFFDTPVNSQIDLDVHTGGVTNDDAKRNDGTEKSGDTPQGPIIESNEIIKHDLEVKLETGKSQEQMVGFSNPSDIINTNDNENHTSKQSSILENDNTKFETIKSPVQKADSPREVDSMIKTDEDGGVPEEQNATNSQVADAIAHGKAKTNIFEELDKKLENAVTQLERNEAKSPTPDFENVADDNQSQKTKDKTLKTKYVQIKSQQSEKTATSYGYSEDFETDASAIETDISKLDLTKEDEGVHGTSNNNSPKFATPSQQNEMTNENLNLLVEDLSSADLFERNKTKSPEETASSCIGPDPRQTEHRAHDAIEKFTAEEKLSPKMDMMEKEPLKQSEIMTKVTDTTGISSSSEYANPYFTGRLPSFGPKEDTRASRGNNERNVKETENEKENGKFKHRIPNSDVDYDTVSENKSTSRIIELIQEINAPAQKFQMSRERSLTPQTPKEKRRLHQDAETHGHVTINNDVSSLDTKAEHTDDKADIHNIEETSMKVGDINYLTSSVMNQYAKDEGSTSSRFDGLPHIQEISQYNRDNRLANIPNEVETKADTRHMHGTTHQRPVNAKPSVLSREHSNHSGVRTIESTTVVGNHQEPSDINETTQLNKRSSSENDLKDVVASAKHAYRQQITSSSTVLPPLTRETSPDSQLNEYSDASTPAQHARVIDDASHVLICSNCLHQDSNIESAGFCRECQQYLCGNCIQLHKGSRRTKRHEILTAYCVNELEVKNYVKATGYCVDCQHFLCMKCVIRHTGYRAHRFHRIIQSSFMSKPNRKVDRSPRAEIHPSFTRNLKAMERSERGRSRSTERKTILKDLDRNNPYRTPSVSISDSIYPGPDKKLAISYADNPKWPQASVPKLPYLLKPKSLQERAFYSPYVSNHKSAFYTDTKAEFDPSKVKMRALKSRYAAEPGHGKRTHRRKEEGLFTARRESGQESVNLPDIHSKPTVAHHQKDDRHGTKPHGLKKAKLLKEYCISVPFPSGERPADILAMASLPNGKVLIADKHNNNVKLYNKLFKFKAMVKFSNRLTGLCSSNLCPVDLYVATQKHLFEITTMRKGLEVKRKIRVDIKRIEGVTCWKYGLAVVYKKSDLTWEVKLMDYRGNSKSKLEIVNPFTQEIEAAPICYITTIKGGKRIILTDTKNACMICTDVTSRCVLYETSLPDDSPPSYVTSDNEHNVYVSCTDKVQQLSKEGNNIGTVIKKPDEVKAFGCILYNRSNNLLYVQTANDFVSVYQMT